MMVKRREGAYLLVVPSDFVLVLRAEHTIATRLEFISFFMISAISLAYLPTAVPPYLCTTHLPFDILVLKEIT